MSYTSKDFSSCIFNPATEDLFGKYPELEKLFPAGTADENTMKYIICMYDVNSPMVKRNPDLKLRKQEAAYFVGIEYDEDAELFSLSNPTDENPILAVISSFLKRYAFPLAWAGVCADEQTYYEYCARMMKPIKDSLKDKDEMGATALKSKLSEDKEDIRKRIMAGYRDIFGDDENLKKHTKKKTTAESMATTV